MRQCYIRLFWTSTLYRNKYAAYIMKDFFFVPKHTCQVDSYAGESYNSVPFITQTFRHYSSQSLNLKEVLAEKIPPHVERVKNLRKNSGAVKIGDVTLGMAYGGMRGLTCLVWETSVLHPVDGIRFRGYTIPQVKELLPKPDGGQEPLPEGMFWLLLTGDIPTKEQVNELSKEWAKRGRLPEHAVTMLKNFPRDLHPMSQFSSVLTALNYGSNYAKQLAAGTSKQNYWKLAYEDAMDLIAKLPQLVASIYRISLKGQEVTETVKEDYDWSRNLANLMGQGNVPEFADLMRLYLTIHSDHEGGNVSAHAVHLVGSALADPYLSLAAGLNGLAGPLHGLANQQVLVFIHSMIDEIGTNPSQEKVVQYVNDSLKKGVIPGYGHAVLRKTDPRFLVQRDFGMRNLPDDPSFKLVNLLYEVVPGVLAGTGKVQNPWPNVDANSGVLLQYYGVKEMNFYTVLFGMSRSLGTMASLIWSRAMGLPIERPKSYTTDDFERIVKK